MTLIRHRQRAITSVTAPNAPWINPSKFGGDDPLPDLTVPSVYYNLNLDTGIGNSSWTHDGLGIVPTYDTTGPFRMSIKFRVEAVGSVNQVLWYSGTGIDKRLMLRFSQQDVQWSDGGTTYNFPTILWVASQWYLLEIIGEGDGGAVTCSLRELPTGNPVASSPITHANPQTGTVTNTRWRIGDNSTTPVQPFNGDIADARLYQDGKLVHHTPIDEGGTAIQITERIQPHLTVAISGTGNWVPILVFALWTPWVEDFGFTGGTFQEVISQSQFTAETGTDPPPNHRGEILKIVCMEENTNVQMSLAVADDPSAWTSWCPRYYSSQASYDSLKLGTGAVQFRLRAAVGNMHSRGLQADLSGLSNQQRMYPILDPNDQDWIVGAGQNNPQNYGVFFQGGYTPGLTTQYELNVQTPTAANGFVSPTTVYMFDWLKNLEVAPIKVCFGWDDSFADCALSIEPLALTHNLKQVIFHQSSGYPGPGTQGAKLTGPQMDALQATGRWENVSHADIHTNYQTRTAASVSTDIAGIRDAINAEGWPQAKANLGSRPENGDYRTTDNFDIADIESSQGRTASRKGHWGMYHQSQGLGNPMKIGSFALGQGGVPVDTSGTDITDSTEFLRIHNKAKQMGTSYIIYGHTIAASPTGLEFDPTELNTVFAQLRTDIDAGTVEVVFFSEFIEAMQAQV